MSYENVIFSVYRVARNLLLLRVFKLFFKKYKAYKDSQSVNCFKLLYLCDKVDTIQYANATVICNVLSLRGGQEDIGFFIALFKLMQKIEAVILRFAPEPLLRFWHYYDSLRKKNKYIQGIEDFLVIAATSSTVYKGLTKHNNDIKGDYSINLDSESVDYLSFISQFGIDDSQCGDKLHSLFKLLNFSNLDNKLKIDLFQLFASVTHSADNATNQKGYVLCLYGIVEFFWVNNRVLCIDLLKSLLDLIKSGSFSEQLYKLIIRRLKRANYIIPDELLIE